MRTGQTTIEFWTYAGSGSPTRTRQFWTEVAKQFEKENPGVHVRLVTDISQGNYVQMLSTRVLGGHPPDVMIFDDNHLPALNVEGLLMPLDDFIARDTRYRSDEFAPSMVADTFVNGHRYSIPWYGGYLCLFYRTDWFAEAGLQPPKNYAELLAVCRVLREKYNLRYPFAWRPDSSFTLMPVLWQNGGRILSADFRTVAVDSPAMYRSLEILRDLIHRDQIIDPAVLTGASADKLWLNGQAAILLNGSWMIGIFHEQYPDLAGKWAAAPVPILGDRDVHFYGGQHLVLTRKSRHPDLAWKFMVVATRPEMQARWSDILGAPPGNMRTLELPGFCDRHPDFCRTQDAMRKPMNNPLAPFFNEIWGGRFGNLVMDEVLKRPDTDITGLVHRAAVSMQAVADEYWKSHPHFVQGQSVEGISVP